MADKIRLERDYGAEYEPTDSDDDYSEEEKELLKEVRKGRERNVDKKQELLAFADSDDAEDDDDEDEDEADDIDDLMHDSDIEGAGDGEDDDIPDAMDWGSNKRNYYNADFVDPDYSAYTAEEEELAKQEEEEAKAIQQRLAKQMREEDFLLGDDQLSKPQKVDIETIAETTKLKADFSGLSKREKQQLFQKDSPEFAALVDDFKCLMKEVEALHTPVLNYVHENNVPMIPALEFTQVYRNIALTYCSNISFYLLLKAKRIAVRNHPITKRLAQLKKLLVQLQDKYENIIRPQLEALLERIIDGDEFQVLEISSAVTKPVKKSKSKLAILKQYDSVESGHNEMAVDEEDAATDGPTLQQTSDEDTADEEEALEEDDAELDADARRGITYEIAKNKGLTPHRKKEARNPRVKHRNKFRKALVRRKGAVRTVRKETKRYGGEISGIKATVSKSIKFKA